MGGREEELLVESAWVKERDPPQMTDALRLGRMRVFSEVVRRWKLPSGLRPEKVVSAATAPSIVFQWTCTRKRHPSDASRFTTLRFFKINL